MTILICRVNGKLFATSSHCPHYGAPLIKAPLSSDGKLVCQWHGACFKFQTGEIEDGPTLKSLLKFEIEVDSSMVYILEPKMDKQISPKVADSIIGIEKDKSPRLVIIGGGASGAAAAVSARMVLRH